MIRLVTSYFLYILFAIWNYSLCTSDENDIAKILQNYHFSDFDSSMYTSYRYKRCYERIIREEIAEARFIELCKARFNFFLNNIEALWQETPKIPKILHQIWLGQKPFPEKYKELTTILRKKHPTWIYKLWTDEDAEEFNLINRKFFSQTPSLAEKSNILRYEILFQYGGVYVDTDFECLKSFDFMNHCCDFYAGLEYVPNNYSKFIIGNALIASKPKHVILATVIEQINKYWDKYEPWSRINQLERSGTRCLSKTIKEVIFGCKGMNIIFPSNIFYPFNDKTIIVERETLGIHYWDSTWLKL